MKPTNDDALDLRTLSGESDVDLPLMTWGIIMLAKALSTS